MKRTLKLVRVSDQEIGKRGYRQGLQAMWEDRWMILGASGRTEWIQSHGAMPPVVCPLLSSAPSMHGVRRLLTGGQAKRFVRLLQRIRMHH